MAAKKENHFVLIHGARHGAWCWYKVVASLTQAGHRVTALDMSACGINLTPVEAVSTLFDYFRPLLDFMASLPSGEKVVLVGHSMGGAGISLAMEAFPEKILVAVYLTAIMPGPNLDYSSIIQEFIKILPKETSYKFNNGAENSSSVEVDLVYNLSPLEDLSLAHLLMRPFPLMGNADEQSRDVVFTEEKYGSVNRVFVIGDHELLYKEEFVKWMIENNPVRRIITISQADHMSMFSNPIELCKCLEEIAEDKSLIQ